MPPLYFVYRKFIMALFTLFIAMHWIEFYRVRHEDIDIILDNISITMLFTIGNVKAWICKSELAQELLKRSFDDEDELMKGDDEEVIKIHREVSKEHADLGKYFSCLGYLTLFPYLTFPVIEQLVHSERYGLPRNHSDYQMKPLVFRAYVPFDTDKHYFWAYLLLSVDGWYGCNFVLAIELYFMGLMVLIAGKMRKLQFLMENFKERVSRGNNESALIKQYVMMHQTTIK